MIKSLFCSVGMEKEMATHFSILAWKIPWTESLAGSSPWAAKQPHNSAGHKDRKSNNV